MLGRALSLAQVIKQRLLGPYNLYCAGRHSYHSLLSTCKDRKINGEILTNKRRKVRVAFPCFLRKEGCYTLPEVTQSSARLRNCCHLVLKLMVLRKPQDMSEELAWILGCLRNTCQKANTPDSFIIRIDSFVKIVPEGSKLNDKKIFREFFVDPSFFEIQEEFP